MTSRKKGDFWTAFNELVSIPAELLRKQDEAAARDVEILGLLKTLKAHALGDARRDKAMSKEMDALKKEVEESGTVVESAVTLIEGLAAQIREAAESGDPAALEALAADLDRQGNKLAEAVQKNTPHQPSGM
jgi:hypothetical protein